MSPEGFLVTKKWRKRPSTLPIPAQPCSSLDFPTASDQHTPIRHHKPPFLLNTHTLSSPDQTQAYRPIYLSDLSLSRKDPDPYLSTRDLPCQLSMASEGQTARMTTVHEFLDSLHPISKKVDKRKKAHIPKGNVSQHIPKLRPLIFKDETFTPVPKFGPRSYPSSTGSETEHRPASKNPTGVSSFPLSSPTLPPPASNDELPDNSSSLKPLSSWKNKITVTSSTIEKFPKKENRPHKCKKTTKRTLYQPRKRRSVVQKPPLGSLRQLELVDIDDAFPQCETQFGLRRLPTCSSNIGHTKFKPAAGLTTIYQTAQWISPPEELPIECSPAESEPIISSPPRLRQSVRLPSMADSIICSPKITRSRILKPRNSKRGGNDMKKINEKCMRILDLRGLSMDENEISPSTPTQSCLRSRRLDIEELPTRRFIDPLDRKRKESVRQLGLRSVVPYRSSASNTSTSPPPYSRLSKRPSFSAEEILEKLLPVASQVLNSNRLEKGPTDCAAFKQPSFSSSGWINRQDVQPSSSKQKCPSSSVVHRTKSILRRRSTLTSNLIENGTLCSGKLKRRMTVMFDDRQTIFGSSSPDPRAIQRKLSQVILPPSSVSLSTPASNVSLNSSLVRNQNRKPTRRLSDLPRSFSAASFS